MTSYLPLSVLGVDAEQRQNLDTLASFLEEKVRENLVNTPQRGGINFNMTYFNLGSDLPSKASTECGAVACAIGHGPLAGIEALPREDWYAYGERVFGAEAVSPLYNWCFHAAWAYRDNTAEGAAKRIRIALEHGVPENWLARRAGSAALYPECIRKEPR